MKRFFQLLLLLLATRLAYADPDPLAPWLEQAQKRAVPLLLDFSAPWCHSCYYMDRNVLNGTEWTRVEHVALVARMDTDSPEGSLLKERYGVKGIPTYLFLTPKGEEIDRILGDMPRAQFYARVDNILARRNPIGDELAKVVDGSEASLVAARHMLEFYVAREDADSAFGWIASLPESAHQALAGDARADALSDQLHFLQAIKDKTNALCRAAGDRVLEKLDGCERLNLVQRYVACTEDLPEGERKLRLAEHRSELERDLDTKVLHDPPACSDDRDMILGMSEFYRALGDRKADDTMLARAIAVNAKRIGPDVRNDRNRADNQRVFLDQAGRTSEHEALLKKLVAAYPDDYVYANRYARFLAGYNRHETAVDYFAKAAKHAYGVNRLHNAQGWVTSLRALKRDEQAHQVVVDTLQANGPWFPGEVEKLKALLGS